MTLKDEYYAYVLDEADEPPPREKKILFDIVRDFTDRRGLRQEWEQIDDDIQEEILSTWLGIIKGGQSTAGGDDAEGD
jgi:hypothetical protein